MGVETVGDLARVSAGELEARFGEHGAAMARRARGVDRRPVVTEQERKSVSGDRRHPWERTFSRDLRDIKELKRCLWRRCPEPVEGLSKSVARRLERAEVVAGTITIKLRYGDFETLTRQMSLGMPTDDAVRIYGAALVLLEQAWERGRPVRLLGD